jgi:hypothetical protein
LSQTFQLTLSKNLRDKFQFHCKKHPSVEWSGVLFYRVLKGDISDISNLHIEAFDFLLMDVGSGAATNYDLSKVVLTYMLQKDLDLGVNCYMGHIHSHHSMQSYFSSVDEDELCLNAPQHNAYLSVIVNCRDEVVAKLAQVMEVNTGVSISTYKDFKGIVVKAENPAEQKNRIVSYNAVIKFEENLNIAEWEARHAEVYKPPVSTLINRGNKPVKQKGVTTYSYFDQQFAPQEVIMFTRPEVETFLKSCLNLNKNIDFLQALKTLEKNLTNKALAAQTEATVHLISEKGFNKYNALFSEDVAFDGLADLLDECVSMLELYYLDTCPNIITMFISEIDELSELWSEILVEHKKEVVELEQNQLAFGF